MDGEDRLTSRACLFSSILFAQFAGYSLLTGYEIGTQHEDAVRFDNINWQLMHSYDCWPFSVTYPHALMPDSGALQGDHWLLWLHDERNHVRVHDVVGASTERALPLGLPLVSWSVKWMDSCRQVALVFVYSISSSLSFLTRET
jgi:hypothetical protein